MDVQSILTWLTGGGGLIALISACLTHKAKKTDKELNLIDRLSSEIKRLDIKIKELEEELKLREKEINDQKETILRQSFAIARKTGKHKKIIDDNARLRQIIEELRVSVDNLKNELKDLKENKRYE